MIDRLEDIETRFNLVTEKISDSEIISDQNQWRELMKEHSILTPIIEKFHEYKKAEQSLKDSKEMLEEHLDDEMKQMVKDEMIESKELMEQIKAEITILLLPKDPNDEKNVIVEIRGGAGGDEAALFAADLYRMYNMYADKKRWKTEIMNINEADSGGFKEAVFMIYGKGAYSRLKYESGVHRVQRIPETESNGRIHTSTVTVAVLPEAEELDFELDLNDVRVDVFRSSGNGGQSVNTTDSAVRVTHGPSGIVVSCQDEKSQLKNKDKALKILRAKLYEAEIQKRADETSATRKSQVGTGDRSERIRTYNYPQGRITDHRIGLTLHKLEGFLNGELDEMMDGLITTAQADQLKQVD